MASTASEVAMDFSPLLKIYKDGHVERLIGEDTVPPSTDPATGVDSKDVVISPESGIYARLYLPKTTASPPHKIPLLIYFHGGGFCIETPSSPQYHNHLNALAADSNVVAVSVHYRRAPEHPLPIAYEDSWAVLKWVASHLGGNGPEEWLNSHADLNRLFLAGDSAGANIAHQMAIRVGSDGLDGVKLRGIVLVHPYFWGKEPIGDEINAKPEESVLAEQLWSFVCPTTSGSDDPLINPGKDPKLGKLGCERVLVCVGEKDLLKDRGFYYSEVVKKSGWKGDVEVTEAKGEPHVFHLMNPTCENALGLLKKIASFINHD